MNPVVVTPPEIITIRIRLIILFPLLLIIIGLLSGVMGRLRNPEPNNDRCPCTFGVNTLPR